MIFPGVIRGISGRLRPEYAAETSPRIGTTLSTFGFLPRVEVGFSYLISRFCVRKPDPVPRVNGRRD